MSQKFVLTKGLFRSPIVRTCLVIWLLLAVCLVSMAPRVKVRYDRWSASQHAKRAADFLAKKDYTRALLDARAALELNPLDLDAIRVVAQSLEGAGSPEAIRWRRRFDQIKKGDCENTLAWAMDAMRAGDVGIAERVLGSVNPDDRGSAEYHDIAARIAMRKLDLAGAEAHWLESAKLDPKKDEYQWRVATLQLRSHVPGTRARALETLKELSGRPGQRLPSLRALLDDASENGETVNARELADQLVSEPDATFEDRLKRLATLRAINAPESAALLLQLRAEAAPNPLELFHLLRWMNRHDLALLVVEWSVELPAEVTSKPPVCAALAEAYDRAMDWKRLGEISGGDAWGQLEYLRQAYRARALARSGDAAGSAAAWEESRALAGKLPESLEAVAKMASAWGWKEKTHQVMVDLSNHERCPQSVLKALWSIALKRGETTELFRLSKLMAKADPTNVEHRNNVIFLGLLLHEKDGRAHEAALALYREQPSNSHVVATYALSCYQNGLPKEAVAAMETLGPPQLRDPGSARYYGIFLAAAKTVGRATEWLDLGSTGDMLPEEKVLMMEARLGSADRSAAYLAELNELMAAKPEALGDRMMWMSAHDLAPMVSNWSATLAPALAARPKVSMAIAEAHEMSLEWKRLEETTEAASWGESDYLRNAYLARALERLDDAAGSDRAWTAAVQGTGDSPKLMEELAKAVRAWGWEDKTGEVLWKRSEQPNCPRWAIDFLWGFSVKRGELGQLVKASALMASDSKATRTRNNAIVLALLDRDQEVVMGKLAEILSQNAPSDAALASIHALALHQAGRPREAFAIVERFPPDQFREPGAAFYYGILLTVARQSDQAKEYLDVAATRALLIEENALVTRAGLVAKASPTSVPAIAPRAQK
jgi:hypothetical protein